MNHGAQLIFTAVQMVILYSTFMPLAGSSEISDSMNSFGLELLKHTSPDQNVMISPFSICTAVAMLNAGAVGNTKAQIDSATHCQSKLLRAFGWTGVGDVSGQYKRLLSAFNTASAGGDVFNISSSNRMYVDLSFQPLESYTTTLSENFGADLEQVNFSSGDNSATVTEINTWVEKRTNGKIKKMIDEIPGSTKAILINTIYFKAFWMYPFSIITNDTFYLDTERVINTDAMTVKQDLYYYRNGDMELVILPYKAGIGDIGMVVILPVARGGLMALEQDVIKYEFGKITQWIDSAKRTYLKLSMPKFEFQTKLSDLKETFRDYFGITDVFGDAADLSGISGDKGFYVSDIIHRSFIAVLNEDMTEAAAATAIASNYKARPREPEVVLKINQPFLFLIFDLENMAMLFAGRLFVPGTSNGSDLVNGAGQIMPTYSFALTLLLVLFTNALMRSLSEYNMTFV